MPIASSPQVNTVCCSKLASQCYCRTMEWTSFLSSVFLYRFNLEPIKARVILLLNQRVLWPCVSLLFVSCNRGQLLVCSILKKKTFAGYACACVRPCVDLIYSYWFICDIGSIVYWYLAADITTNLLSVQTSYVD